MPERVCDPPPVRLTVRAKLAGVVAVRELAVL